MWEWVLYLGSSAVLLVSGARLCRETDALAARWGWTRSWAGLVVLATVTSLPELLTGISSVTLADTPRIALGDALGSLAFNLAILAVLAIVVRRRLFQLVDPGQRAATTHLLWMTTLALGALVAGPWLGPLAGWVLLPLPFLYALVMRDLGRRGVLPPTETKAETGHLGWFFVHAGLVIVAAGALPYAGSAIAASTGLGKTFVGGLLVALSTSLPEIAVTLAAWRLGAPDLALGNLLGSNLFDLAILGVDEALYPGPLLSVVEAGHLALTAAALAMTGLVAFALRHPLRLPGRVTGSLMLALYLVAQAVSFEGA